MASIQRSKIGILGGSFDPVHLGHCAIAQMAYEHFSLEKLYFIPAYIPPHKQEKVSASPAHRLAMLRQAVKGNGAFHVWDGEIQRQGISFTVDTLKQLKELYPHAGFYFIIGSDNIPEVRTWRKYKSLLTMVTLCITRRPGYSMRIPKELSAARIKFFPSPQWGIGSSLIRGYISRNISCRYLVPSAVIEYIRKHKLYRK